MRQSLAAKSVHLIVLIIIDCLSNYFWYVCAYKKVLYFQYYYFTSNLLPAFTPIQSWCQSSILMKLDEYIFMDLNVFGSEFLSLSLRALYDSQCNKHFLHLFVVLHVLPPVLGLIHCDIRFISPWLVCLLCILFFTMSFPFLCKVPDSPHVTALFSFGISHKRCYLCFIFTPHVKISLIHYVPCSCFWLYCQPPA